MGVSAGKVEVRIRANGDPHEKVRAADSFFLTKEQAEQYADNLLHFLLNMKDASALLVKEEEGEVPN